MTDSDPTTDGQGAAALVSNGVEFDSRDAALLREIDRTGSVARASSNLGRSRARALSRIDTLEDAFGELVERHRGGSGGGGSQLTQPAEALLGRYERLQAALTATAQVPETVLRGTVTERSGELAEVDTAVGAIRGLHDGVAVGDEVQARIGADSITLLDPSGDPEPDATSARNRLVGSITEVDRGETVLTARVSVGGVVFQALVTADSARRLALGERGKIVLTWKATATRLVGVDH
ncbi:LysR family transcriptional regulator [Halovenus sp. WSH3]|uniref:LysR family transcriptional regulator n=1 Tax=Halovenus carboxidivorans TaxID=2692199 RepID=A0A6B0T5N3_9EURY|nr:TOBE domain-containing protein [Halovenus carboxidivorans]MXR51496.1 LysR family transcriptional regulator [Halovenus carboxidivorans]